MPADSTRLADMIEHRVFVPGVIERSIYNSALFNSGAVVIDPLLQMRTQAGDSRNLDVPYLLALDGDEPNVSSDDPAVHAVPKKVGSANEQVIKAMKNQAWSTMDILATIVATEDPALAIESMVGDYWSEVIDKECIAMMRGIVAQNIATDAGDMINDISAGATALDRRISASAVIRTKANMGDRLGQFFGVTMHSAVYATLQEQQQIDFRPGLGPARQEIQIPFYQDLRVHVSDACFVDPNAGTPLFHTYFYVMGAFRYGEGNPKKPVDVEEDKLAGNGGGEETLISRKEFALHCAGFSWMSAAMAGFSPTWAERADPTNYQRLVERKRVGLAVLISEG